jgi:GTPase SAR1 family protein
MATASATNMQQNPTIHYKLVLLGDASVGKSCLVVRFVLRIYLLKRELGLREVTFTSFKSRLLVQRL